MTKQRDANDSWLARWREHRRVKRQEARERAYFVAQQARHHEDALSTSATDRLNASGYARSYGMQSTGFWGGFGGDGGGC